jgi:hypothetical protein
MGGLMREGLTAASITVFFLKIQGLFTLVLTAFVMHVGVKLLEKPTALIT